jgi:glycosyltransferase involved in cell wall biosynthesis
MVFTYTIKPNIYGAFAASVLKKQSVAMVTGIGTTFTAEGTTVSQKLIKALVFLMHKASLRLNKTVIFQNKDDIALFKELGLIQDGYHIEHVRGSGVDCTHYEFSSVPDSGNVLMISRLLRTKGVSEFCLAAKSLRQMGSDLTFVLVGPEERGQDSVSVAEVVRWSDGAVSYLGAVQDVRSHIAKSWLYVLPSYREGLSRSIAEALAMGRAVVTTDVPGCAELIQKGVTGYIISKGDHEELALAILEATRDRGKLKEMGVASREFACEYLDTKLINAKMLQILLG